MACDVALHAADHAKACCGFEHIVPYSFALTNSNFGLVHFCIQDDANNSELSNKESLPPPSKKSRSTSSQSTQPPSSAATNHHNNLNQRTDTTAPRRNGSKGKGGKRSSGTGFAHVSGTNTHMPSDAEEDMSKEELLAQILDLQASKKDLEALNKGLEAARKCLCDKVLLQGQKC